MIVTDFKKVKWSKGKLLRIFYDLFTIFISFAITDCVTFYFNISFWLFDLLIYLISYLVFTLIGKGLEKILKKSER